VDECRVDAVGFGGAQRRCRYGPGREGDGLTRR